MSVWSGQTVTKTFNTRRFDTGAAANADSLPTGTLLVNGVANAAGVTVTNQATGRYNATVTLPTLAIGDLVELEIAATVNSISDAAVIWYDAKDVPTAAENADTLLGRNVAGGSSTGRTVKEALASLRNRVAFDVPAAGQFTVFDTDDVTPLWTGSYSTSSVDPVTAIDPA